ncbi:MAG: endonuclease III [Acholeplasmataceae bacterium]
MKRIERILAAMDRMFPEATVELEHDDAFQLLVAVVLSAQTTDVSVNRVTRVLFERYPTPQRLARASYQDVEAIIRTIGLYRNKAKNIIELAAELEARYNGTVPADRALLEALPGVGRKTANVVLSNAFRIPALAVDTHVARVSVRLGLAQKGDSVRTIEEKLMQLIPRERWQKAHHQFIFFGRYHCLARKPKCRVCPLYDICIYENKEPKEDRS